MINDNVSSNIRVLNVKLINPVNMFDKRNNIKPIHLPLNAFLNLFEFSIKFSVRFSNNLHNNNSIIVNNALNKMHNVNVKVYKDEKKDPINRTFLNFETFTYCK